MADEVARPAYAYRATGLLAAAAVGTTFAATVGLLNVDPARDRVFPSCAAWQLLSAVLLVGAGVMFVLWPAPKWMFGPNAIKLLDRVGTDRDVGPQAATHAMLAALVSNDRVLRRRMTAYRATVVVLMTQVALLVLAMIVVRG